MLVPDYTEEEADKILAVASDKTKYENIDVDLPVSTDLFCPILNNTERYEKLVEDGLSEMLYICLRYFLNDSTNGH